MGHDIEQELICDGYRKFYSLKRSLALVGNQNCERDPSLLDNVRVECAKLAEDIKKRLNEALQQGQKHHLHHCKQHQHHISRSSASVPIIYTNAL